MAYITQTAPHPVVKIVKVLLVIFLIIAATTVYLYLNPSIWQTWVKGTPLEPEPAVTTLYKWQDSTGEWQISDTPPAGGIDYEIMKFRSDTNVMPLVPREENE